MLRAGGYQVDAGGLHAGMAQDVGQLDHVLAHMIETPGEQVAQVVGEDLALLNACRLAQPLHFRPNLLSGNGFSASGEEDLAGGDFLFSGVLQQLSAQLSGQQNGADLSFQGNLRFSFLCRLHGDPLDFRHPDARGADGFQQEGKAALFLPEGSVQQAAVFLPGELFGGLPEGAPLQAQGIHPAVVPALGPEEGVQGRQLAVDCGGEKAHRKKMLLPLRYSFPRHGPAS